MRRCLPALTAVIVLAVPAVARADEGDIIVQRAPGLDSSERAELRKDAGVKFVDTLPLDHTELVEPTRGKDLVQGARRAARRRATCVHAELDQTVRRERLERPSTGPRPGAWSTTPTPTSTRRRPGTRARAQASTVAVVDTGINATHVDLKDHISPGWDFVDNDAVPEDDDGHGSHVAGTIAADAANERRAWSASRRRPRSCRCGCSADGKGDMSGVIAAFDYAGDHGVRIVNASIGGARTRRSSGTSSPSIRTRSTSSPPATTARAPTAPSPARSRRPTSSASAPPTRTTSGRRSPTTVAAVDLFAPGVEIRSASNGLGRRRTRR